MRRKVEMDDKFEELSIGDIFNILIKRKKLIAIVTLAFIVFGLLESYVLTKPRYESGVSLEINSLEPVATSANGSSRVYNILESITSSTNMSFEDYKQEITSDEVLEKTIEDLKLEDKYTKGSLKSAISINADPETQVIDLKIVVKEPKLGAKILESLTKNLTEHITIKAQENSSNVLDVIEEQMDIEREKYGEALKEYEEATKGKKSAMEVELEIEATYKQLTDYKLSLNDLQIRKDGINGALEKADSQSSGMILRPNKDSGNIYLDTGRGTLEADLAETEARISSTKKSVGSLQEKIESLKTEYQEIEFAESVIRQKVELTKESYEVFATKHQELGMQGSMDIGGISIKVLSETISENKAIGTRKAIKLTVLTILGLMTGIILSFVLEVREVRKRKKLKR